ncbi:MAG: hypothetical protein AB7O92_05380 [Acidimicrobiia bacterium]
MSSSDHARGTGSGHDDDRGETDPAPSGQRPHDPISDEGHRRRDPLFGEGPVFGRKRAAVEALCAELTTELEEVYRQLIALARRRRDLAAQLTQQRRRLHRRLPWPGRSPASDGAAQLPPIPHDATYVWGRRLRSTCRAILSRLGQATLVELHATMHRLGFAVASRTPVKALADALGYDADAGHVLRIRRGTYGFPPGARRPTAMRRGGPPIGHVPPPTT